ncbi:hypothetical protein [Aquimarina algicola]|uniref:Uncharacterized protein n=1 Tax=Aquimarina algicola TaxID=2589995 RepID=A0A504J4I4_9FLAO|nr:hypothetical protein [Aquimarina algicola]TPN83402.1 hypothetical protein FHK87_19465 [Aquimarina algicola]
MGLAEKRIIKNFQEVDYKVLLNKINDIAGFEVELEIDWDSLSSNDYSHLWESTFPKIYFQPIIEAFKAITTDDMGKEALKESISKITIQDKSDNASANSTYSFKDGNLMIDHSAYINADMVEDRSKALIEVLEQNL